MIADHDLVKKRETIMDAEVSTHTFLTMIIQESLFPTKLQYIWPNGFRAEEYKKSANQIQESPVVAVFVN